MKRTARSRRFLFAASATFCLAGGIALSANAAAPLSASQVAGATKATTACNWTQPLPPLPAACNGVLTPSNAADTIAKCKDPAFWKGACGSSTAVPANGAVQASMAHTPIVELYCHKALVESYCADPVEETLTPAGHNVHASAISMLKNPSAQKPSLFTQPKPSVGGKQTVIVPAPSKGGRAVPRMTYSGTPTSQTGGPWLQHATGGGGTYETSQVTDWVGKYERGRPHQSNLHFLALKNAPQAQLNQENDALFAAISSDNYVGDGSDTPAHREVNSCSEFAYQRWYDYTRFKNAAKALGHDYRAIYNLAFSPQYNLEKSVLRQFAIGNLPENWPTDSEGQGVKAFPHNVFLTAWPSFRANVDNTTSNGIKGILNGVQGQLAAWNGFYVHPPQPGGTRFALHKSMAGIMESKYHMTDDDFNERRSRMRRYQELVDTRNKLQPIVQCGIMADLCCNGVPYVDGGTSNKVIDKVRGVTVSNPDPNQLGQFGMTTGDPGSYASFSAVDATALGSRTFGLKGDSNIANKAAGMAKQKSYSAATTVTASNNAPVAGIAGKTCQDIAKANGNKAAAALVPVANQLSDLLVAEYGLPNHGCLEPTTSYGNSCDWSYEMFAHMLMTYFDDEVEADFKKCQVDTKGDFHTLRDGTKQVKIYPCELRHDFGDDQLDANYFMDSTKDRGPRYSCEKDRANAAIQDYLADNKALVAQIPLEGDYIGESSSDQWLLGDESSFGASAGYSLGWKVYGGEGNKKTNDGSWCHPDGSTNMNANANIFFFGSNTEIFNGGAAQTTGDGAMSYAAHMRYYDMDQSGEVDLFPPVPVPVKQFTTAPGQVPMTSRVDIPLSDPQVLGDLSYDIWFSIGPIPIHISFGANASIGVDVEALGHTSVSGCTPISGPIENKNLLYQSGVDFEPWAEADAYADASIDVVIASAGIRMDLTLLRLGLPVGVNTNTNPGATLTMKTGCHLTTDALEGNVSAYLTLGIDPFSHTWSATLFSWDGLHSDTNLFGTTATVPLKLATWDAQPSVDHAKCMNYQSPGPAPNNQSLVGHPRCLLNPTKDNKNDGTSSVGAQSCIVPIKVPDPQTPTLCTPYYQLRGPTQ